MSNREGTPIWYELMTQNPDVNGGVKTVHSPE